MKTSAFRNILLLLCVGLVFLSGVEAKAAKGETVIPIKAYPFNLNQVRLLDGPFKKAMELDRKYLHDLEADRLLHTFRLNAGLPSTAEPLGAWERPIIEVRGHTMGHYLSACAFMVASTGDEKLKAKADAIVAELAKCQQALGESGYLSAFPESFIDRVEAVETVWAPYYVLHKIMTGLVDMHIHCGNEQALEAATGMAAWLKSRCDRLDDEHMQRILLNTEQGGMNDGLTKLYGVTGNPDHLALARRFDEDFYNDPLIRREDRLKGQHVNSFIPNIIGTAHEYEKSGDETCHGIATFFWDQVTGHRCYATGGTSNDEFWRTDPGVLAGQLSRHTQETCCQYNMLKLTRHLFGWNPDPKYADYYERTLFNSILSTQHPETGMMMYFVPLVSGHFKIFNTPNDSFWCCTGTGLENHAKYGDSIYFHDDDGIYVNLFIASELVWKDIGIVLRQETRFPEEEGTTLVVETDSPRELALRIRIPYWADRGVSVKINGETQKNDAEPCSYLTLKRVWKDGDRVEVALPMSLHLHPMPDDERLAAILYGPLVLVGDLGPDRLAEEERYVVTQREHDNTALVDVPRLIADRGDLEAWIKPVAGEPLTFRTAGVGDPDDVTLIPFHQLFDRRYAVYWPFRSKEEWKTIDEEREAERAYEAARIRAIAERTVDRVEIGDEDSEREHNFKSEKSRSGPHQDKQWRDAIEDGWFSYDLKVLPDRPISLLCTYWGDDGGRTFDILVDGEKVFQETLDHHSPGKFFSREYRIPPRLTRNRGEVTVKFQCHEGKTAGGVFECVVLRE